MQAKRFPNWLKKDIPRGNALFNVRKILSSLELNTVCENAKCPNKGECFSKGTATFMIMGNICTRNCRFCAVKNRIPEHLDLDEPDRVAKAAKLMGLTYVVITSVTRDDLPDGGSRHFSNTLRAIRATLPEAMIEILAPDFKGNYDAIYKVVKSQPTVFNHNLETVPRLYPLIRPDADYYRSLKILQYAKGIKNGIFTKSGLMLGFGEKKEEVIDCMKDLKYIGCDILTIGQYISPSDQHFPVHRFLHPDEFKEFESIGKDIGFTGIASGPFIRSSYHAGTLFKRLFGPP
ncbi:MAG: lipoyl synthase [Thermodesulfobacteriota bacterium]|nr:lipoyl synthase [Thermodesulfobacteriota bacterium]